MSKATLPLSFIDGSCFVGVPSHDKLGVLLVDTAKSLIRLLLTEILARGRAVEKLDFIPPSLDDTSDKRLDNHKLCDVIDL